MDTEALTAAIDDASADIDSYLVMRYQLPLSAAPEAVKRICVDITMYHLSGNKTTEEVEKRYKQAIAWLRDVSKGIAGLGNVSEETDDSSGGSGASFSTGTRQMTRTTLAGGF